MANTPTQVKLRQEATLPLSSTALEAEGGRGGGRQEEKKKREVVMGTDMESPVCEEA